MKQELEQMKMKNGVIDGMGKLEDDKMKAQMEMKVTELERELAVLKNNNNEDVKLRLIKLEQDYKD
jgi:hypothetical protein